MLLLSVLLQDCQNLQNHNLKNKQINTDFQYYPCVWAQMKIVKKKENLSILSHAHNLPVALPPHLYLSYLFSWTWWVLRECSDLKLQSARRYAAERECRVVFVCPNRLKVPGSRRAHTLMGFQCPGVLLHISSIRGGNIMDLPGIQNYSLQWLVSRKNTPSPVL